jgi:branched-subunit amino acid ABC-type transport system permease component
MSPMLIAVMKLRKPRVCANGSLRVAAALMVTAVVVLTMPSVAAAASSVRTRSRRAADPPQMDAIVLQLLNGLDKGGAYALIALGLTLIFGTLGVVNFAHGALFMIGGFCAVATQRLLTLSRSVKDESVTFFDSYTQVPYLKLWFGETGERIIDYAVPLSILVAIPAMLLLGVAMERGLVRHFYRRPHADQILVTFGLAIVLQEIVKAIFAARTWARGSAWAMGFRIRGGAWSISSSPRR